MKKLSLVIFFVAINFVCGQTLTPLVRQAELKDSLTAHRTTTHNLTDSITAHRTRLDNYSDSIDVHRTSLDNLTDSVAVHRNEINYLTDSTSQHRTELNQLSDSISSHRTTLDLHSDTLTAHKDRFNTYRQEFKDSTLAHRTLINNHTDSLSQHRTELNFMTDSTNYLMSNLWDIRILSRAYRYSNLFGIVNGSIVYDSTLKRLTYYDGTRWNLLDKEMEKPDHYNVGSLTYYVNYLTGNDTSGTGSSASPYRTLIRAEAARSDGDTVIVAAGTYVCNSPASNNLYLTKAITWIADGEVILKANAASTTGVVRLYGTGATKLIGFTIDGENTYDYTVNTNASTTNKTLQRCTIINVPDIGLYANANTSITLDSCTYDGVAGTYGCLYSEGSLTVKNSTFKNITGANLLYIYTASGATIFDNNTAVEDIRCTKFCYLRSNTAYTITDNHFVSSKTNMDAFVYMFGTMTTASLVCTGNVFETSYATVTYPFSLNNAGAECSITFSNNTIKCLNASQAKDIVRIVDKSSPTISGNYIQSAGLANCASVGVTSSTATSKHASITNNYFVNPATTEYIVYIGADAEPSTKNTCDSAIVSGNYFYGARHYDSSLQSFTNHGLIFGWSKDCQIKYNHFYGCGYGVVYKANDGWTNSLAIISYNDFVNTQIPFRIKGQNDVKIYNNTIYADTVTLFACFNISRNADVSGTAISGIEVKNNIVYTAFGMPSNTIFTTDTFSTFTVSYNCIKADSNCTYFTDNVSVSYSTYATFLAAGYNTNGINSNPLFWDVTNYYMNLKDNSPCIDVGVNTGYNVGLDKNTTYLSTPNTRAQGSTYDLGAYIKN